MQEKKTTPKEHQKVFSKNKPEPQECQECGDLVEPIKKFWSEGWIKMSICSDCLSKIKRKEEEHARRAQIRSKQARIEEQFEQSRLGKRFRERTFENFKVNDSNRSAYRKSRAFSLHFEDKLNSGKGIIFIGNFGTGKTHLAASILQEVIKKEHTGIFVSIPDLIAKIRKSWDGDGNESDLIDALVEADLVVMDDLGAENTKDWVRERLFVIINSRYERMLPTIFTTNCSFAELRRKVGGRIESRICEMCEGITLVDDDYRKSGG